jgi:DNA polymerase III epsilon subunit family exonuclease
MRFAQRLLEEVPLAVLDTETTGLQPALGHRVIELAILRLEGWEEVGQFDQLINPGRTIPADASRINEIYDEDVAGELSFTEYADQMSQLLEGAVVVAHHAAFDAGFIAAEWTLAGRPPLLNPCICTLQLARLQYSFWRNNLSEVAHSLGVRTGRTHRAMRDTWVTARVFQRMTRDLRQRGIDTVGDIVHAQGGPIYFPPPPPIDLPPPLDEAVRDRSLVRIRYLDGEGNETERVIEPYYLGTHRGDDYLVAFCQLRNMQRTFRIDRILAAYPV